MSENYVAPSKSAKFLASFILWVGCIGRASLFGSLLLIALMSISLAWFGVSLGLPSWIVPLAWISWAIAVLGLWTI